LITAEIEPTDNFPDPKPDDIPPLEQALQLALQNRPELAEASLNLRNQAVSIKAVRNSLLPTFDLFGAYTPAGLSGNLVCGSSPGLPPCPDGAAHGIVTADGAGESLSQVFRGKYPDYSFGATLNIPIRNRTAQADAARAQFEQRQLQTQLQNQKNSVEQDVRNAEIAGTQAKAQIDASAKAVELARQTLDADRKKFQLGETTTFQLIQDQRDVATAEGNAAKARQTYAAALTQFAQATATILDKYNVQMADAKNGKVSHPPNIPGAQPSPAASSSTP
jgi:outer membrane protein TolC